MKNILKRVYNIELGSIDDAVKERQREANDLKKNLNFASASARDLIASVERAENKYKQAKKAFDDFKQLEKEYNNDLDFADKMYSSVKRGFDYDNELESINEELRRYNSEVKPFESNVKDLIKAKDKWKSIASKFPKIK